MTTQSKSNAPKRIISAFPVESVSAPAAESTPSKELEYPIVAVLDSLITRLENPIVTTVASTEEPAKAPEVEDKHFVLPDHFDVVASAENRITLRLEAYKTQCLNCSHLVPSAKEKFTDCHVSSGNAHCPAASAEIVFVGRRNHFLQKLLEARSGGDITRLNKILDLLRKESKADQEYVMKKAGVL